MDAELQALVAAVKAPGGPAVVRVPVKHASAVKGALRAAGWAAVTVDRAPVFSKETLLHALYQACPLPGWFGFNWDALLDALCSWSDRPGAGGALFVQDLELLEERAPEVASTFLEVLREARDERGAALRLVRLTDQAA